LKFEYPKRFRICQVRLGQAHAGFLAGCLFPRLDAHLGAGVRVDLPEETELDLAGKEAVLSVGERPGVGLVHVALGDVSDEVARHADVEEQLAGTALPIERERLARPGHLQRGGWAGRRGLNNDGLTRRGLGLGFEPLEPLGHGLHLLSELLQVLPQRLRILGRGW
jgi:hypothetical protein